MLRIKHQYSRISRFTGWLSCLWFVRLCTTTRRGWLRLRDSDWSGWITSAHNYQTKNVLWHQIGTSSLSTTNCATSTARWKKWLARRGNERYSCWLESSLRTRPLTSTSSESTVKDSCTATSNLWVLTSRKRSDTDLTTTSSSCSSEILSNVSSLLTVTSCSPTTKYRIRNSVDEYANILSDEGKLQKDLYYAPAPIGEEAL